MSYKSRRIIASILGVISGVGTVATTVLAVKETPKAIKKLEELKKEYPDKIPFKVYLKSFIPIYWPAIVVGAATIASPIASTIISRRTEASLIATSTMLSQGWNKYKYKVKDLIGINNEKLIRANIAQDTYSKDKPKSEKGSKKLYYEEHIGWFYADPVELQAGLEDINQRLYVPDRSDGRNGPTYWATLFWFIRDSKAEVLDEKRLAACEDMGWTVESVSAMYAKRFVWVHPSFTRVFEKETGELKYTVLSFYEEPVYLNMLDLEEEYNDYKEKGKDDYMHEAESNMNFPEEDIHDYAALDLVCHGNQDRIDQVLGDEDRAGPVYSRSNVYYKDYDNDDPMFADQIFSSSSPSNTDNLIDAYEDGTNVHECEDRIEPNMPKPEDLKSLKEVK